MLSFYLTVVETDAARDKVQYIYENFYSFMAYTAKQVLHDNPQDIEDAVHNAMIKIIENLDLIDLSDLRKAKNLCGIIAKNKAKDLCRLRDNQNSSLEDVILDNPEDTIDPVEIVMSNEVYDTILNTIYSMDEIYRDVCLLRYINEFKETKIAELLDMSVKTVSVRIYRGKLLLREALRKENIYV